jgi:hypothetical protein
MEWYEEWPPPTANDVAAIRAEQRRRLYGEPVMMCEACERGDHELCGMQTWCECDCAGFGEVFLPDHYYGDPPPKPRTYGECPNCGVRCWLDVASGAEPNLLRHQDCRKVEGDYGPGQIWTEVWRCPACGHEFQESNGYP